MLGRGRGGEGRVCVNHVECVCVFITGEGESQKKGKQILSYEERR